ncbi:hypothetical protein HK097_009568 [Rhizophlyctis rosea]|uniref:Uncharacterized protein n=1 Tax=Rhizophlyctis rosea TaxID=64517 RepID=A0AAD5S8P7_9FUNG|nr:hypothetical protein HK097_009568 [Rhizophlyctis rosea]
MPSLLTSVLYPSLAGAVASQAVGIFCYGPILGQSWVRAIRTDKNDPDFLTKRPSSSSLQRSTLISSLAALVRSAVHLEILRFGSHYAFFHGLPTGEDLFGVTLTTLAIWAGYTVPIFLSQVIWEYRQPIIPLIGAAENLASLTVAAWVYWLIGAV